MTYSPLKCAFEGSIIVCITIVCAAVRRAGSVYSLYSSRPVRVLALLHALGVPTAPSDDGSNGRHGSFQSL